MIRRFSVIVILSLFIISGCAGIKPASESDPHCSRIKLKVKVRGEQERYSTTIVVKFRENRIKMFFLGGVVKQVFMKLLTGNEKTILVNSRKKRYWEGSFSTLTERMWGVTVTSDEFIKLISKGDVPEAASRRLKVTFTGDFPSAFRIIDSKREISIKNGKVTDSKDSFTLSVRGYKRVTLSEVFNND